MRMAHRTKSMGDFDKPFIGMQFSLCSMHELYAKNFLISVLSDLLVLMTTYSINHWQLSYLPQPALVVVGLLAHTNKL